LRWGKQGLKPNSEEALPGYTIARVDRHDHEIGQQKYPEPNGRALPYFSLGASGRHYRGKK
jgi:hypothetical protein